MTEQDRVLLETVASVLAVENEKLTNELEALRGQQQAQQKFNQSLAARVVSAEQEVKIRDNIIANLENIIANFEAQVAELTRRLRHSQAMFETVRPLVVAVGELPIQSTIQSLNEMAKG